MSARVLVDGSNVLFWRGGHVDANVPELVVRSLRARRFIPELYFDHSIWRHVQQGHLDVLASLAEITIAPKGTTADELLLNACGGGRVQIVSNDRFRAWRADHPNLQKDWLVTGSIGKGERVSFSKRLRPPPL